MKKTIFISLLLALCLMSCTENKTFKTEKETITAESYGLANEATHKNNQVVY